MIALQTQYLIYKQSMKQQSQKTERCLKKTGLDTDDLVYMNLF